MKKRILSLLLSVVMLFSSLPLQAFAAEDKDPKGKDNTNSGSAYGNQGSGSFNAISGHESVEGMRFSLYFIPGDWTSYEAFLNAEKDLREDGTPMQNSHAEQGKAYMIDDSVRIEVGKLEVVGRVSDNNILNAITKWSDKTIFDRMALEDMSEFGNTYLDDFQTSYIRMSDIPFKDGKTEDILKENLTEKEKKRWVKFFAGENVEELKTQEDIDSADFYNLSAIVYKMYERSDFSILNANYYPTNAKDFIEKFAKDFKDGKFVDNFGEEEKGVYKFYFEPTAPFKADSTELWYMFSLRDMIAFNKKMLENNPNYKWGQWSTLEDAFTSAATSLGNATYLSSDEPLLKMYGRTTPFTRGDVSSKTSGFKEGKPFYNSAGVGVITGCPRDEFTPPKVKIVTSVVGLKSYELQGDKIVANLEQAAISEVRDGYVDEGYGIFNLKDNNVRNQIIAKDGTKYYLNDIYATVKDIIPGKSGGKNGVKAPEVIWEGSMPVNRTTNDRVEKNYKNIDAYIDNMVLGNVEIAEDVFEKATFNVFSFIDALRNHAQLFVSTTLLSEGKKVDTAKEGKLNQVVKNGLLNVTNDSSSQKEDDPKEVLDTHTCAIIDEYVPVKDFSKYTNKTGTEGMDPYMATSVINEVKESRGETPVVPQKVGKVTSDLDNVIRIVAQKSKASKDKVLSGEAEIVVYLRYIAIPETRQVNILIHKKNGEEIPRSREIVSTDILNTSTGTVTLKDIREDSFPDVKPVEYYTHETFENNDIDKIPPSDGDKTGKGEKVKEPIPNYPIEKTVYVFWEMDEETPPPPPQVDSGYVVPQWRLSKYWPHLINSDGSNLSGSTSMHFSTGTSGCCCCGGATLSGSWSYTMVNPNGTLTRWMPNLINQMKVKSYLHSKTLDEGSTKSPTLFSPSGRVTLSGNLNAIKSTDKSGLKLATWLNPSLADYDIEGSTNPLNKSDGVYKTFDILPYKFKNINSFFNMWFICSCEDGTDDDGDDYHITRYTTCTNTIGPDDPSYSTQDFGLGITFNRYNQQAKDKLKVDPVVSVENGLTTLKYQLTDDLSVYPEYGMLFQSDDGHNDLKWVVGDENRQINPVVYQTLQHKVYVSAVSSGTSVATDSRAITNAQKLGEGNKQVIYKGSAIGNAFTLHQDSSKQSAALLTVKTYALDINTKNADLKSAWGDSNYHSDKQHEVLINSLNGQKAKYDEKLLIDSPNYGNLDYTGGSITTNTNNKYELRNYSGSQVATKVPLAVGGNAIVLEHELIVRGGKLVAVRVKDTNGGTTLKSIEQLRNEGKDSKTSLYAALVNMHLIDEGGNRANTVFTAFEHLTGDVLTEDTYATLLNNGRNAKDGYNSTSEVGVSVGQGWYSEDTTVLVVKEYISNLTVPSVSVTDKIALSVNGLVTPQNKAQFFNTMGKGYLYLNYDLTCKDPITGSTTGAIYEGLPEIHSGFTFTSFPNDEYAFGEQQVNYLVPNVTALDATSIS